MPVSTETSQKLSDLAKTRPRDAKGHFIKAGTDPATTVAQEITTQTPLPTIQNPPTMTKRRQGLPALTTTPPLFPTPTTSKKNSVEQAIDAPLVVINNPFKAVLHWLNAIRKKQTTTFDFKISVPLIALPIFLIVLGGAFQYVFTLGKEKGTTVQSVPSPVVSLTPKPIMISKVGVIRGTYASVLADEVTPTVFPTNTPLPPTFTPVPPTYTPTPTFIPTPTFSPTPTPLPPARFVLVDKDEKIFFLITPQSINLARYLNQRVLVTGRYDAAKETITITKYADIEVLP